MSNEQRRSLFPIWPGRSGLDEESNVFNPMARREGPTAVPFPPLATSEFPLYSKIFALRSLGSFLVSAHVLCRTF